MTEKKSFFTTLPGILTGIAAVVTAASGLIFALSQSGLIGSDGEDETKPAAVTPKTTKVPNQPVVSIPKTPAAPNQPVAIMSKRSKEQTTDGWAIIGFYRQGKFSDLKLMVHGDSPAIGRSYDVVDNFRLVQKRLEQSKGKAVITLGTVHRGESVEVLDIEITPGTRKVPVWAKLRAALHRVERPSN